MKKIALFVEGFTEVVFWERLLLEIYGEKAMVMRGSRQGGTVTLKIKEGRNVYALFYVYDCRGDSQVRSSIEDHRERLIAEGFTLVIGVIDLYPKKLSDLSKFSKTLLYGLPQKHIPIKFVVSVMETESIFIWENTHFEKIHPYLTMEFIKERGVRLLEDYHKYPHPAAILNEIYSLAGKSYDKVGKCIKKTVESLNYSRIYVDCSRGWMREAIKLIETDVGIPG